MNKVDAAALKLEYNPLPLTKDNCPLPPEWVDDTNSFFTVPKVLTALAAVLAVGHGGSLLEDSWDDLMKALVVTDKEKTTTSGKERKVIVSAYKTLRSNGYHSYLWTDEVKLGVKRKVLPQIFCDKTMAHFCLNMFIRTATCRRKTENYVYQHKYFDTILKRALKKRQEPGTESYNMITAKYTPATANPRK